MKNVYTRYFWTEAGRLITGDIREREADIPPNLPTVMQQVLETEEFVSGKSETILNAAMFPRAARHIYSYTWEILRGLGFNRTHRIYPWDDIELYLPFFKDRTAVIPQSFGSRIPHVERAYAIVGKSSAALSAGWTLWTVIGNYDERVLDVFKRGGVKCCSLDRLAEVLSAEPS